MQNSSKGMAVVVLFLSCSLLVIWSSPTRESYAAQSAVDSAIRWEYRLYDGNGTGSMAPLNELGKEGWELVSTVCDNSVGGNGTVRHYLKRKSGLLLTPAPAATADDGKVEGRITVRGKPLAGRVTFHLDDQFVGSKVNEVGKYKVNCVLVGRYKVTIEGKGVPAQFTFEDKTPLTVEVKEGGNTFDFALE